MDAASAAHCRSCAGYKPNPKTGSPDSGTAAADPMLTNDLYCRAIKRDGTPVSGWIVCDRHGVATHLNIEARTGGKSGVCVSLKTLIYVDAQHVPPAPDADCAAAAN